MKSSCAKIFNEKVLRCVIVSLCAENKYYVFCSALVHKRCRLQRDSRVRAAWRSECVACTCTRTTSHRVDRGSMRRGPWVSTSILGFFVGFGVLVLFTEAFHVRRRSDNIIHKLSIMMFTLHSASWVICETGSQPSIDFGAYTARSCWSLKSGSLSSIGIHLLHTNVLFDCVCALCGCRTCFEFRRSEVR